jgi:hypothetical protein
MASSFTDWPTAWDMTPYRKADQQNRVITAQFGKLFRCFGYAYAEIPGPVFHGRMAGKGTLGISTSAAG